jgi:FkbM family methyltransferase
MTRLIFDLGCHRGEDSRFYLAKGFRVIGVEANPALCAELRAMFSKEIASGHFTLVENAIAEREGTVPFYVSGISIWGSLRPDWAGRADDVRSIDVPAITFGSLIEHFGMPYYLKIDIEGADILCLQGLQAFSQKPNFVSFECGDRSIPNLRNELALLRRLACRRFQIINQAFISAQREPFPAREGCYVGHVVTAGSSGLFGNELSWLSPSGFVAKYMGIYAREKAARKAARASRKAGLARVADALDHWYWYDIHAAW